MKNLFNQDNLILSASIVLAAFILAGAWIYVASLQAGSNQAQSNQASQLAKLEEKILPAKGLTLPINWGDLGKKLIEAGVIDKEKFENLYSQRGGLSEYEKKLLNGQISGKLTINRSNAGTFLNLLWAFGLANKNEILEKGPMTDARYGGAGRFASTGGWTLAQGKAMDHYSQHELIKLTPKQQALVKKVAQNIYRPCCNNSTYFPDCNHGMAMLGLLELLAASGAEEQEIYKAALQVNAYWFPQVYLNLGRYLQAKGLSWDSADPKGLLSANFSSASGYQQIQSQLQPISQPGGASCGV